MANPCVCGGPGEYIILPMRTYTCKKCLPKLIAEYGMKNIVVAKVGLEVECEGCKGVDP